MCGIIGFTPLDSDPLSIASEMCREIRHRGPDSSGVWLEENCPVVLGHTRLSILELSEAGHQPMVSDCSRYVLVLNGEIYNHLTLRTKLESSGTAYEWRGHSDTETLLACFAAWGIEKTLQATVGMFAIALWDKQNQVLTLARDRMGEKPLYWGWSDDLLVFASELKAIKAHPDFKDVIDRDALTLLLRHCYIPAPYSIYQGIQKLLPGHYLQMPLKGNIAESKVVTSKPYWSLNDAVEQGVSNQFLGTPEEAVLALEQQLRRSDVI
jgi:asparagine synthase (glutamine-hydrolysing)